MPPRRADRGSGAQLVPVWLVKVGLPKALDLALLAHTEAEAETNIIEPAKAGGVPINTLGHKVAITKRWTLAQCAMQRDEAVASTGGRGEAHLDDPLLVPTVRDLVATWLVRHRLPMCTSRLMTEGLMARAYRQVNGNTRHIPLLLAEQVRILNAIDKRRPTSWCLYGLAKHRRRRKWWLTSAVGRWKNPLAASPGAPRFTV